MMNANSANQETTTDRSTSGVLPLEISTDHATKALRERVQTVLYYHGPFRVYFRKETAPRIVSIANGSHTWEIHCKTVKLGSVALKSGGQLYAEPPDPGFWLEGLGQITVDAAGNAVIQ